MTSRHFVQNVLLASLIALTGCAHLLREGDLREEGSRGSPSKGWLVGGTHLPERGRGYTILRPDRDGGQHWGTRRLVDLVQDVAGEMLRAHGQPLVVGELSGRGGGNIIRHASHRNGRDVDLLFFALDASTQEPVPAPAFVRYNSLGASIGVTPALTFDTERNWALVETLVRHESVGIVRLFCANWIKRLLMTYAREHHRPDWVLERAEALLMQPGDAAPHDDHFHVRVACTPQERARGCVTGGPIWHWLLKDWDKPDVAPADDEAILDALEELPPGVMHGPPLAPSSGDSNDDALAFDFHAALDESLVCRLPPLGGAPGAYACFSREEGPTLR